MSKVIYQIIKSKFYLALFSVVLLFPQTSLGISKVPGLQVQTVTPDILETFSSYFLENDNTRVKLEVEVHGLTGEVIADTLAQSLGGKVDHTTESRMSYDPIEGDSQKVQFDKWKVRNSSIGKITIVPEFNGTILEAQRRGRTDIWEIITIISGDRSIDESWRAVQTFQKALDRLRAKGAKGTSELDPVGVHFNIELGGGNPEEIKVSTLLNIARNYMLPLYQQDLESHFGVIPKARMDFLGMYSHPMMERLSSPEYSPSWSELMTDFLYRQIGALIEIDGAWEMREGDIREAVKSKLSEKKYNLLPVVKLNHLRITSVLMFMNPEDWLTQYLEEMNIARSRPALEFRDPNTDFEVLKKTKQLLGLIVASEKRGYIQHDKEVSAATNISIEDIEKLRSTYLQADGSPYVVRLLYEDPVNERFIKYFTRSTVIDISNKNSSEKPLVLPGESVVYHRMNMDRKKIKGKYNPSLVNIFLSHFLVNKFAEAKFFEKYAPGTMAETELLADLIEPKTKPEEVKSILDKKFPNGWVIKGTFDTATQVTKLITHNTKMSEYIKMYKEGDFTQFIQEVQSNNQGVSPDYITRQLRSRKQEFIGWRLNKFFKYPHTAIVQAMLPEIQQEYRVEVVAGQVLGRGTTVIRYNNPKDPIAENNIEVKRVEHFVQKVLNQLPWELQGMAMGMDVAVLSDGSLQIIESNTGGNSGFLVHSKRGVRGLDSFLRDEYIALYKSGQVPRGMSAKNQMAFIRNFMNEFGLSEQRDYPHLEFTQTEITYKSKPKPAPRKEPTNKLSCNEVLEE